MIIQGIAFIIGAYLLGSIPFGFLFSNLIFKKDIRELGSGNIGATNIYRSLGPVAGITVLILDVAKGALPLLFFTLLAQDKTSVIFQTFQVLIAFAAIIGHTYSVFLNFSGGKGVATTTGVLLVLSWKVTLTLFIIWTVMLLTFRYVSLGSVTIAVALPFLAVFFERGNTPFLVFGIVSAILVVYKHRSNIKRIIDGSESKILERS